MLKLYITRHGETDWNVQKRMQGWADSELTINGINNAISLGKRLKNIEFNAVYVSPSQRTVKTAQIICDGRKIPIIEDKNLREIHVGDWEGKTLDFIKENYPTEFSAFWEKPHLYGSINGETFQQLQQRVLTAVTNIIKENDGNVLVVTHAVVIKVILAFFKNLPIERIWDPPYISDTSLTVIEVNGGNDHRILLEGDITHLQGDMKIYG